jgi:hypothetical protein
MAKGDSTKADFLRRAEEARQQAAKATDPKAKMELMRLSEMWERLARTHKDPAGGDKEP